MTRHAGGSTRHDTHTHGDECPPVPERVLARVDELGGPSSSVWARRAPLLVQRAARHCGVTGLRTWDRGRSSWVLRGQVGSRQVVVKVPIAGAPEHIEAQLHLARAGVGPEVLWSDREVMVSSLVPGRTLDSGASDTDLVVVARRLGELRRVRPAETLPSMAAWLRGRLTSPPADVAPDSVEPTPSQLSAARELLDRLAGPEGFCHGDANGGNVLVDGADVWLLDARGVAGDVAYDVAVLALKARGDQADDVVSGLAEAAGVEPGRAEAWLSVARAARV